MVQIELKKIKNLPKNLKILNCEDNQIEKLENLPLTLEVLNCCYNPITTIENLSPNVKKLDCDYCQIKDFNIQARYPNIKELTPNYNKEVQNYPVDVNITPKVVIEEKYVNPIRKFLNWRYIHYFFNQIIFISLNKVFNFCVKIEKITFRHLLFHILDMI